MAFVLSPEIVSNAMLAVSLVRYDVKELISPQTLVANGSGRAPVPPLLTHVTKLLNAVV